MTPDITNQVTIYSKKHDGRSRIFASILRANKVTCISKTTAQAPT